MTQDYISCLHQQMALWEGDITELLRAGKGNSKKTCKLHLWEVHTKGRPGQHGNSQSWWWKAKSRLPSGFWPSKHKLDSLVFTKLLKKGLPPQVELCERFLKRNILMPVPPTCTDTILISEPTSGDYHLILSTISPLNLFKTLLYTMKVQLVLLGSMEWVGDGYALHLVRSPLTSVLPLQPLREEFLQPMLTLQAWQHTQPVTLSHWTNLCPGGVQWALWR